MVLSAMRRTLFAAPPVEVPTYTPDMWKADSTSAAIERAVEQMKAMNLDPQQPSGLAGDIEPTALSAHEARAIARMPLIVPMIAQRVRQSRQAGKRRLNESDFGYELVHKDPDKTLNARQRRVAQDVYDMLERGRSMSEKMALIGRDSFEIDRGIGEIAPARSGVPFLWDVWDGATMRWAYPKNAEMSRGRYNELTRAVTQWMHGREVRTIPRERSIVLIRNPTTDVWRMGYGYPEVEQGADDIHRGIQADTYNGSQFDNGMGGKFLLKLRMKLGEDEFKAFNDQLQTTMRGLSNAHRFAALLLSPKMGNLAGEEDIERLELSGSNKDMEYRWMLSYYYRRVAALMGIDLEELGMGDPADTGKAALSEPDSSWKIAMSKEKGLSHFLDVCSIEFTRQLVEPFDDELKLVFAGLNSLSPEKQLELDAKMMATMSYNDFLKKKNRKTITVPGQDWPDLIPLNSLAVQLYTSGQAMAQQADQAKLQGQQPPADVGPDGETGEQPEDPTAGDQTFPVDDELEDGT